MIEGYHFVFLCCSVQSLLLTENLCGRGQKGILEKNQMLVSESLQLCD